MFRFKSNPERFYRRLANILIKEKDFCIIFRDIINDRYPARNPIGYKTKSQQEKELAEHRDRISEVFEKCPL